MLHPTRLAFEGVAWLAVLTAALAAAYSWRGTAPGWELIFGFALLWTLRALTTYFLHRSFNRSSREQHIAREYEYADASGPQEAALMPRTAGLSRRYSPSVSAE